MNKRTEREKDGRKNTERSDMCLSFVNTQLRDFYPDLDELCSAFDTERSELEKKLQAVGYTYDREKNQFR